MQNGYKTQSKNEQNFLALHCCCGDIIAPLSKYFCQTTHMERGWESPQSNDKLSLIIISPCYHIE